ncbi:apolipoprotein N-acyltransferase [Microvirga puerhi]|uniref:Apolipoprotein N-acyltransferase n=1 Tax=Microvirga puerhi TaxID=2876078 RepID=A0ABS7VNJ3_9HYPH|nr:apolipoprotein N-acyltransferase [Microvirga puerhi]MBZ6077069.1 apolipoprotein N-acyltransferase [Microvirga puerhi]
MKALAQRVALARGWRRGLLAVAAGAIGALAMPPFGFLPALVLSLTPAVWLIDGDARDKRSHTLRAAAIDGWLWGFGYFVAGLWWLGAAFLVEADEFAWALPFGVLGLPALLAFFPAFGFALARLLWSPGMARIFAFAFALTVSEWLRGHLFTGFPWNTLGMALGQNLWLMQTASLIGLYGLTVLAIWIGAAPALLGSNRSPRERWTAPVAAIALLGAMAAYGAWRVPPIPVATVPDVRLRLMQPNLPQDAKFNPDNREAIMRRYLTLSAALPDGDDRRSPTHLIWPESAFPFLLHRSPAELNQIAELLPPGMHLITGAARMDDPFPGEAVGKFFNAIQVVDDRGTIVSSYDKVHLVPFGEYVPKFLDALMGAVGLRQFVHIPGGFEPSEHRGTLTVPGLPPVAATICYEAIFPGEILPEGPRPQLILNVTNDAWFGDTPGPYQHFAQARLRTIEEGLPLVRDANTGISAVVDPFGRVTASMALGAAGVLDAHLPVAIAAPFAAHAGMFVLTAMLLICLMAATADRWRFAPR